LEVLETIYYSANVNGIFH